MGAIDLQSEFNREVIYFHTGQCGVQIGNAIWELMSAEHGVRADGLPAEDQAYYTESKPTCLYTVTTKGNYVPRALIVDSEPTVIDEIRTGIYRNLYGPQFLINGIEDAANNFARGRKAVADLLVPITMRRIREQVENCSNLQSFFFIYGTGGGTGSGFTSNLMQTMQDEFAKKDVHAFCVSPGRALSTIVVEPYNICMAQYSLVDFSNSVICVDNESLYNVSSKMLNNNFPTYNNVNRLLSQIFSDLTCAYRYQNWLGNDLHQTQTNVIPYPRIHFLTASYAPLFSQGKGDHAADTVAQMTKDVFKADHQLTEVNLQLGKFMACSLNYRGLVGPAEVNQSIQAIKRSKLYEFVDWSPTGFKIGICAQTPVRTRGSLLSNKIARAVLMISNSTSIGINWRRTMRKFEVLHARRAFIHWYVMEGMEEGEITEAKEEIQAMVNDYKMIDDDVQEEGDKVGLSEHSNHSAVPSEENQNEENDFNYQYPEDAPDDAEVFESNVDEGNADDGNADEGNADDGNADKGDVDEGDVDEGDDFNQSNSAERNYAQTV